MSLHLGTKQEPKKQTELLGWEVETNYTRGSETVTPVADTDYPVGTIMDDSDVIVAGGTFTGIVLKGVAVTAGNTARLLTLKTGPAWIKEGGIEWPSGLTDPEKAAIRTQIEAAGIQIKSSTGQFV